jgi:anti-sigma regulatory factor (Ser/Thr protein kinase)
MPAADPPSGHGTASVAIAEDLDVFDARWSVRRVASALGFAARDIDELVVAASELATNILKFSSPGRMLVEGIEHPEHGIGIRITAQDSGAPIGDFEQVLARSTVVGAAMEWTGRGLGGGLGAVYRFTDVLTCAPCEGGKQIVVERYLDRPARRPR